MKYKVRLLIVLFIVCITVSSCGKENQKEKNKSTQKEDQEALIEDEINKPLDEGDMGSYMFGPKIGADNKVFVYSGNEIHIPFEVQGLTEVISDFGLMLFVNGDAQPYKILSKDGKCSEEAIMHNFSLENNQIESFDMVFTPLRGKEGDKVGVEFATIFKPDFIPESKEKSQYNNYHELCCTVPQVLYFEKSVPNSKIVASNKFKEEDITDEIIKENMRQHSSVSKLDQKVVTQLLPNEKQTDSNNNVFISKNNKIKFRFRIMGGPNDINYRTYIYINHEPVKILGYDCLDSNVKKGKMCTYELELDTTDLGKLSTIYAISNPIGNAYMSNYNFATKTRSGLVVNE